MNPSSYSNCEPDEGIHLMTNLENYDMKTVDEESSVSSKSSFLSTLSIDIPMEEQEADITLENCSNSYFSGYLAMKCVSKFACLNCEKCMIKNDFSVSKKFEYLIFCKNYDAKISEMHLK